MVTTTRRTLGAMLLGLVAYFLAHQLVYLRTWGSAYGEALRRTGHGDAWTLTMLTVMAVAAGLTVVALVEVVRLTQRARAAERHGQLQPDERITNLANRFVRLVVVVAAIAMTLFGIGENLEHAAAGAALPMLGVLGGTEYDAPVPTLLVISVLVAAIGAIYGWRRAVLMARLRLVRARFSRPSPLAAPRARLGSDRRPETHIGRGLAGRAPPLVVAT